MSTWQDFGDSIGFPGIAAGLYSAARYAPAAARALGRYGARAATGLAAAPATALTAAAYGMGDGKGNFTTAANAGEVPLYIRDAQGKLVLNPANPAVQAQAKGQNPLAPQSPMAQAMAPTPAAPAPAPQAATAAPPASGQPIVPLPTPAPAQPQAGAAGQPLSLTPQAAQTQAPTTPQNQSLFSSLMKMSGNGDPSNANAGPQWLQGNTSPFANMVRGIGGLSSAFPFQSQPTPTDVANQYLKGIY